MELFGRELTIKEVIALTRMLCPDARGKAKCQDCLILEAAETLADEVENRRAAEDGAQEDKPQRLCAEDEHFVQDKFGYCFFTLDSHPLIYNLYIHPQYRRQGHSHEILRCAINIIRESGYKGKICIQAKPKEGSIGLKDLEKGMGLVVCKARFPEDMPEGSTT